MSEFVEKRVIWAAIEEGPESIPVGVKEILDEGNAGEFRMSRQPAAILATTLGAKYSLAMSRGATVEGLEGALDALRVLGDGMTTACVVEGRGRYAMVVMDELAARAEAAIVVTPAKGALPGD